MSGSSLFTLGFVRPPDFAATCFAFLEAAFGLGLLALLIAYLPTIYAAFSRREVMVGQLAHVQRAAAVGGRDPGAHPPHGALPPARRRVGAVAGLVRGDRGDAHVAGGRELLPLAHAAPLVDHRRGRGARRGVAAPRRGRRRGLRPAGRAARPFGSLRAHRDRRLLRPAPRCRPRAHRPDHGDPRGVRGGVRRAGGRRGGGAGRPRRGVGRLRGLAGQLRPRAGVDRGADHGALRAVVVGPLAPVPPAPAPPPAR